MSEETTYCNPVNRCFGHCSEEDHCSPGTQASGQLAPNNHTAPNAHPYALADEARAVTAALREIVVEWP